MTDMTKFEVTISTYDGVIRHYCSTDSQLRSFLAGHLMADHPEVAEALRNPSEGDYDVLLPEHIEISVIGYTETDWQQAFTLVSMTGPVLDTGERDINTDTGQELAADTGSIYDDATVEQLTLVCENWDDASPEEQEAAILLLDKAQRIGEKAARHLEAWSAP
jgi:hypothetical protein